MKAGVLAQFLHVASDGECELRQLYDADPNVSAHGAANT